MCEFWRVYLGVAQNHLGSRTDILDCCPKAEGMIMLIRSMSPRVLAVDEIGVQEEIRAVEYAMQCGCKLIASVHGNSMAEIASKPGLAELVRQRRFERYVVLENREHPGMIKEIFDERGSLIMQKLIGCILILSATTAGGILYGVEQQQYLEKLMYIRLFWS